MAGDIPSLFFRLRNFLCSAPGRAPTERFGVTLLRLLILAEQLLLADAKNCPVLARPMIHSHGDVGYSLGEKKV